MRPKSWDANQLSVVFGVSPIFGFAPDTALTIEVGDVTYKHTRDLHGNITRSRINDNSAKIKLTLMQSSSSNDVLSTFQVLDKQSDAGMFPIYIKDANSTTLFRSDEGYVIGTPETSMGEEQKTITWEILATSYTYFIGS